MDLTLIWMRWEDPHWRKMPLGRQTNELFIFVPIKLLPLGLEWIWPWERGREAFSEGIFARMTNWIGALIRIHSSFFGA